MSLEESLINMVSSLNMHFSKPIGTGGTHAKYEILSFMVDLQTGGGLPWGCYPLFPSEP